MSKKQENSNDPDLEVVATDQETTPKKAKRRAFSAKYKRRILQEYEACTEAGEKGALLRREGIYSSYITTWRRQRERGELGGSKSRKRGPKTGPKDAELRKLEDENKRLREHLRQAELIIEAQKNLSDTWSTADRQHRAKMIQEVEKLAEKVGVSSACQA